MKLHVNGEEVEVPATVTNITELVDHFGIENPVFIVEHNENILQIEEHARTKVREGDKIEFVQFVGGG